MLGIWIAVLSGALMSIQGVWNTQVTKQSSLWVSTGWVQLTALLVCVAAWFFTGRDPVGALWQVENKYTLLGGILGAFITVTVIPEYGKTGSGTGNDADRDRPAGGFLSDRTVRNLRRGKTAV